MGKTLVTGASGFLGSTVVERLLARGVRQIRCFTRPNSRSDRLARLQAAYNREELELIVGNLTSGADACRALIDVDTVYHLAANMRGAPADMFLNTVVASKRLLEAIVASRVKRVVLVSSLNVYGTSELPAGQLIDESTGLEEHPEKRDVYSHAKLRQELLFHEYQRTTGFELVILRPGTIYGPAGGEFSPRIGISFPGLLVHFGGENVLPLAYVENCAEAVVLAGIRDAMPPGAYNVVDDDLPTAGEYVRRYKLEVKRIWSVRCPFFATMLLSRCAESYHVYSMGQIPRILTPYRARVAWRGHRFDNRKLRGVGCQQLVSTEDGLLRAFEEFRARHSAALPVQDRDRSHP